jgi:hypothetical protein
MKTYDKEKILHKWDGVPEPEDAYAETRISGARIACGLLEKVVGWPDDIKRKMVLGIAYLARKAMLTSEEKTVLFGKNMIENGLAEEILAEEEGYVDATVLAALEWMDKGYFPQAAALFVDIKQEQWAKIAHDWEIHWSFCHNPDAATLLLLAHRCGDIPVKQTEIGELEYVVREQYPQMDMLLELMIA